MPLPDINVSSIKSSPLLLVTATNIETNGYSSVLDNGDTEVNLSCSQEKLINMHSDNTFCKTRLKLIGEKALSSPGR